MATDPAHVVIVDNYDSFTYNTVHVLGGLGARCSVLLNDRTTPAEIEALAPDGVLLSAGPGTPLDAGVTLAVIAHFEGRVPLLGVCLGHQAIAHAYGGRVIGGGRLMHGKTCDVEHDGTGLFRGLPAPALMARYNSLLVEPSSLPPCLEVTARTADGVIMGMSHRELPIHGVQFHPESIETEHGHRLLANFMALIPPRGSA